MRIRQRAIRVGLSVSIIAAIVAFATSGGEALLLDVYLLCIGGVLLLALVRIVNANVPRSSPFDAALAAMRRHPSDSGAPELTRDLELATLNEFHLHNRVRPVLREIAANRLQSRYGIDLDAEPVRARELVGAATWDLVRPDRPVPADRLATGLSVAELSAVVTELESM
jgi:hypothetical protein